MNDNIVTSLAIANLASSEGTKHPKMKLELRNFNKTIITTDLHGFIKSKYGAKAFITRNEKSIYREYVVVNDAGRMDATVSVLEVVA